MTLRSSKPTLAITAGFPAHSSSLQVSLFFRVLLTDRRYLNLNILGTVQVTLQAPQLETSVPSSPRVFSPVAFLTAFANFSLGYLTRVQTALTGFR
jgi:hypothetical protein